MLDAPGQMALDEAVLLLSAPEESVLRFYQWPGPACTFGYSQPYRQARQACELRGWKDVAAVRRATGGGIVFHDGDITFSFVFPWDRLSGPVEIYRRLHLAILASLKSLGVSAALFSPEDKPAGLAGACFVRAEPMDLIDDGGRKILGGSLRRKGAKGLYQGSLRASVPEGFQASVLRGLSEEFGCEVVTDLKPSWISAGRGLSPRYAGSDWNKRR